MPGQRQGYIAWLIQDAQEDLDAEVAANWIAVERVIVLLTPDTGTAKR